MARHPDNPNYWKCSVCGVMTPRGSGYCETHYQDEKSRLEQVAKERDEIQARHARYEQSFKESKREDFIRMELEDKLLHLYDKIQLILDEGGAE